MESNIEMKDSAFFMGDDEESVQRPEKQSRHDEEIHRGDSMPMILNESEPFAFLSVRRMKSHEISRDGSFLHGKPQFEQFAMNTGSAPGWIFLGEPSNEFHYLSSSLCTHTFTIAFGKQTPIQTESSPVPGHDRFRVDNAESGFPLAPQSAKPYPKYPLKSGNLRPWMLSFESDKLLP